jgi:hypothetical protein
LLAYLIGTCDDLGKLALLLILALHYGFDDGRVIAAEVDEDVGDAIFPQSLKESKGCCVAIV